MISGKIDIARTTRTAGSRNTPGATRSATPARAEALARARRGARARPGPAVCTGRPPARLALDAERVEVGGVLGVAAELVADLVPALLDLLDGLVRRRLARQHPVQRGVEHDLLVALVLRHPQVEDHVRAVQAVLDGAQVALGRLLAHPGLLPQLHALELRGAVGVEAGPADGDVDVRLLRLAHVGEEGVGRVLDLLVLVLVDRSGPAAEGGEGRVVDAVDRVRAGLGVAADELAALAIEHLPAARDDDRAHLVVDLRDGRVDGERADVAPVHGQRAAPGGEQAARVADVEVDLVGRAVLGGLAVDPQRLAEALI